MNMNFELESLVQIIREAGDAVFAVYQNQHTHTLKKDLSPLTEADTASNRILLEGLSRVAPRIPVMSEEGEEIPYNERKNWDYYFLIDPLDGTKEFIEKRPEFTVNIALIHQNSPILGLIHLPTNGLTYVAERGAGAYKINGKRVRLPLNQNYEARVNVIMSRRDSSEELKHILSELPQFEVQNMGSSLKFCLVAEGVSDFYPRMKPSMEWDTAAGAVIVEESGGAVFELSGKPIAYNRENLLNPPFYVLSKLFPEKVRDWRNLLFPEQVNPG
jgi:3'(2'), 5'-bisphosphate nucleotidase